MEKTSISTPTKFLTAMYHRPKHNTEARYIQKYYLPLELKSRVFLTDIGALMHELNDWNVWKKKLPETLPSCVIHYNNLCLDKTIPDYEVRLILQAIIAYFEDARGELTEDENQAAVNLNAWLTKWEKDLQVECRRIKEDMDRMLRSGRPWFNEYDIDVEVSFYVSEDDYAYDNDAANEHDVNEDASMLCTTDLIFCLPRFPEDDADSYQTGRCEDIDYNDLRGLKPSRNCNNSIYREKHCITFHELYSDHGIPMKDLGRIGMVCTDIKVLHQNTVVVDLRGESGVFFNNSKE